MANEQAINAQYPDPWGNTPEPMATPENTENWDHGFSAWAARKAQSSYHFDTTRRDYRWDRVIGLGRFAGDWKAELDEAIKAAHPVTAWSRNSGAKKGGRQFFQGEYNDMVNIGMDPEHPFLRINRNLAPVFQRMVDFFELSDMGETRLHIQFPGEVFVGHVDGFHRQWPNHDPDDLIRIMINLNDYTQGQFFQFGNHLHQFWRAGDVSTFENLHVPHYTANAGLEPRCQVFLTGVKTSATHDKIRLLKESAEVEI